MVALVAAMALFASTAPAHAYPYPAQLGGNVTPVADPTLLIKPISETAAEWHVFGTANQTRLSVNRQDFTLMPGAILPESAWWQDYNRFGDFWAPDVVFLDGKYWMYYSVSNGPINGVLQQKSALGLATSPTGAPGTWTDQGKIFETRQADPDDAPNALDPSVLVDYSGNRWLVFGSYFGGIYITRIDHATGRPVGTPVNIAKKTASVAGVEGANIYKHGGAYYLFASYGGCCGSDRHTYHVRVGRSSSPTGPFLDKGGTNMLAGGGTELLAGHDWVVGPGGQTVVRDHLDGRDKLVYHYWDSRVPYVDGQDGRRLGVNNLEWDSTGWPYVAPTARTAEVETVEFESGCQTNGHSGPVIDGCHVFAPGSIERAFTVTDDSPYTVAVSARGRMGAGVWPIMRVWLDGQVLQERTVDSTSWRLYRFEIGRLTRGEHRLRFELINDYYGGTGDDDRNIYLDKFTAGSSVEAESMDLRTGDSEPSDGGWGQFGNGRVENAFDFSATGRYVVRVRAKGSFAGGAWPEMSVIVDGVQVAKATVDSSSWKDYELEVPAAAGRRRVGIRFGNDFNGGSIANDRNLWLDTVSFAATPARCLFEGPTRPVGSNPDRC